MWKEHQVSISSPFKALAVPSAGNGRSPGRQMRPKIILGDLIWSEIRVFVARRIMFGRPTLNLCMHSNNRVMPVQTGCTSLEFIL